MSYICHNISSWVQIYLEANHHSIMKRFHGEAPVTKRDRVDGVHEPRVRGSVSREIMPVSSENSKFMWLHLTPGLAQRIGTACKGGESRA